MQTQQNYDTATTTQRTQAQRIIAAQDAVQDAPQLQQLRAGILRLRIRIEGLESRSVRAKRNVNALADEFGWEHPGLALIDADIAKIDAEREQLLADLNKLRAALRVREAQLAAS